MNNIGMFLVTVIMLLAMFFIGMIGRENAIREQCIDDGEAVMIVGESLRCAPIQKVKTLEEAKAIIEAHQKRIGSK